MTEARVVTTRAELRAALAGQSAPGMVPTMGALHAGHESLITRSARENPITVVTLFVNPIQFADPADYQRYPRGLEGDRAVAAAAGADLVFAPAAAEIYPPGFATTVEVGGLGERWEGAARPGHFRGVATVVAILFGLVRPTRAYFGEKDFQQLQLIRRMHADLALAGEVVGCPTVREPDGLALSSRNGRLSPEARSAASAIPAALFAMRRAVATGEYDAERVRQTGLRMLDDPAIDLDYLAVVDPMTLEPAEAIAPEARAIVAAIVGGVRLIDNVNLNADPTPERSAGGDPWDI